MAIERVTAEVRGDSTELDSVQNDYYAGILTAPEESGEYTAKIKAYDDAGNVSVANPENTAGLNVSVTKWKTPKVNWKPTDRFNYYDYNRIKRNLEYLHEMAVSLYKQFSIFDMGEDMDAGLADGIYVSSPYELLFHADQFNLFEKNLETINKNVLVQDFGESQTFYPNGVFIQWDELNRIESAILKIRGILDSQKAGLRRLSFRLGDMKGVKV